LALRALPIIHSNAQICDDSPNRNRLTHPRSKAPGNPDCLPEVQAKKRQHSRKVINTRKPADRCLHLNAPAP
jgi:hypothetical protein